MKLEDRVAIVTGTSPNIGGGIAEGLAAEGAAIVAVDANAANARDCAAWLKGQGGRAWIRRYASWCEPWLGPIPSGERRASMGSC